MRIKSGIWGFDKLIQGGFEEGSLILVSGGPGTGKTIMGLQFLWYGAINDEKGLYISFEETVEDLRRDAIVFGWDFDKLEKQGKCMIKHYSPFEFERFLEEIESLISEDNIKRLVIDSTSIFGLYFKDIYSVRKKIYEISRIVKKHDCICILTTELPRGVPVESVSGIYSRFSVEEFVVDALILLHYTGLGSKYDRTIQILKMRRTNHKKGLFPMRITEKGIEVNV